MWEGVGGGRGLRWVGGPGLGEGPGGGGVGWVCVVATVVLCVLAWAPARVWGRFWGLGSGSRLRGTSVWRCEGADVGSGVVPVRCRGARVACVGVGGSVRAAAALAFAVALRMRAVGRGGAEDEVEEVNKAEDEEEVVDAGWAVMRAGLRAAASAAATAGRMEGMSSDCRLGTGGWRGPVVTWRHGGPIWSAAAGEGGAGLLPSPSGLGWARVLQCARLCGLASAGGNSSRGLHSGAGGGWAWVFWGVCGGRGRATGWGGRAAGRGAPLGGCVWVVERGGAWAGIVRWGVLCRCMFPLAATRLRGQL